MKATDVKKLLRAIDQTHEIGMWEVFGAAAPQILVDLIGAGLGGYKC